MPIKSNISILMFAFLALVGSASAESPSLNYKIEWKKVGDDLEGARLEIPNSGLINDELVFFRTHLKRYKLAAVSDNNGRRRDVKEFCASTSATLCLNANFFDENGKALGVIVHEGKKLNEIHKGSSTINAMLSLGNDNSLRISHRIFYKDAGVREAVQAGPLLIQQGQARSGIKTIAESKRAGACIDKKGRLILFASTNSIFGLTLNALQQILLRPEISCSDAINFDGGGSAQMYIKSHDGIDLSVLNSKYANTKEYYNTGRDIVPSAIVLIRK